VPAAAGWLRVLDKLDALSLALSPVRGPGGAVSSPAGSDVAIFGVRLASEIGSCDNRC